MFFKKAAIELMSKVSMYANNTDLSEASDLSAASDSFRAFLTSILKEKKKKGDAPTLIPMLSIGTDTGVEHSYS